MPAYRLLPRSALVKTNELDQGDWAYRRGPLGWMIRKRFELVTRHLDLLPTPSADPSHCFEIGYGSGIFMPELARRYQQLSGIDVHPAASQVAAALAEHGVGATLLQGSAERLPVPDDSVDLVVALSALEFIDDLDRVAVEVNRVLRPGGHLVVVTPGQSRLLDGGLRLLTGEVAEETFQGRRRRILPTLSAHLEPVRRHRFPALPGVPAPYTVATFRAAPVGPDPGADLVVDLRQAQPRADVRPSTRESDSS